VHLCKLKTPHLTSRPNIKRWPIIGPILCAALWGASETDTRLAENEPKRNDIIQSLLRKSVYHNFRYSAHQHSYFRNVRCTILESSVYLDSLRSCYFAMPITASYRPCLKVGAIFILRCFLAKQLETKNEYAKLKTSYLTVRALCYKPGGRGFETR
jgi:hypothetical protein